MMNRIKLRETVGVLVAADHEKSIDDFLDNYKHPTIHKQHLPSGAVQYRISSPFAEVIAAKIRKNYSA